MTLTFAIKWAEPGASPADATRGTLAVRLGPHVVWGSECEDGVVGVEWTWVDFLEHLARIWPNLLWQPYPLGLSPASPSDFPSLARERLLALTGATLDARETDVWSFSEAHELSHALGGIGLPPLWVVPEGEVVQVAAANKTERLPAADALGTLEHFCSEIAARLAEIEHPRAKLARSAWQARTAVPTLSAISLYTGLAKTDVQSIAGARPARSTFGVGKTFEPNEFLAVARATRGFVNQRDLKTIFRLVRAAPPVTSEALDDLADQVNPKELLGRPFEQGFALAHWLRQQLGNEGERVDPAKVLGAWSVSVRTVELSTEHIDAVSVWGPKHGPLVVVNSRGFHAKNAGGRNATLAHEVCHLLVDRRSALPLAEAAGGLIADDLEARARAFAAELLAPRAAVSALWSAAESAEAALKRIRSTFDVSDEMAAWQIRNADVPLSETEQDFLRSKVSRPGDF